MTEPERKFPERTDLNFQDCKAVKSRKTQEDLLVVEGKDLKTGELYSLWIRKDAISTVLMEIARLLG
jgi:hypothetical protein